jgi:predicted enzyme related to lactoylglutathione lyase
MNSPIQNRIGQVFVPVSDMSRAIAWYSRLLGVPTQETLHEGTIYDVPMAGEARLALDATKGCTSRSCQPLFFLWTVDIHGAYDYLRSNDVQIIGDIMDIGSVTILTFADPDGNLLMVCQRNN